MYYIMYVGLAQCRGGDRMTTVTNMAGERTNYLSVALRARGAIKTLKSLMSARQGVLSLPNIELQQDLESVLRSLRAVDVSEPVHSKLSNDTPYRPFEEVQTFDEVTKSFKDAQALSRLEALLAGGCN